MATRRSSNGAKASPSQTARCCTCWKRCRCCASRCPAVDLRKPGGSPSAPWTWSRSGTFMKACWIISPCAPAYPFLAWPAHARKNQNYRYPLYWRKKPKAKKVFSLFSKSKPAVRKMRCAKPCRKDRMCSPISICSSPATTMQRCLSGWRITPGCCARMTLATQLSFYRAACM